MKLCNFVALTFASALPALAQFSLPRSTVDGGGVRSAGGQFSLTATLGQPDAAPALSSTNGQFKLEPGFWSSVTVQQTPGAPLLKITLIPGPSAVLSWPVNVNGFILEETSTVADPNSWAATSQSVVNTATEHTVTVPAAGVMKCYRLKKP